MHDRKPKHSPLEWLISLIGDAHTLTRKEILAADKPHRGVNHGYTTIQMYLTSCWGLGHVEAPEPYYGGRKRVAYFRRTKRATYTLTEKGWARYMQINKRKARDLSGCMPDFSGSTTKSELAESMAALADLDIVILGPGELTEEDVKGMPVIYVTDGYNGDGEHMPEETQRSLAECFPKCKADDRPEHCDYGLL